MMAEVGATLLISPANWLFTNIPWRQRRCGRASIACRQLQLTYYSYCPSIRDTLSSLLQQMELRLMTEHVQERCL